MKKVAADLAGGVIGSTSGLRSGGLLTLPLLDACGQASAESWPERIEAFPCGLGCWIKKEYHKERSATACRSVRIFIQQGA
jgi:hypothetical protein